MNKAYDKVESPKTFRYVDDYFFIFYFFVTAYLVWNKK